MNKVDSRTLQTLAREALEVQNASNLTGVLHGAARAVSRLRELMSWDEAMRHPITQVWVDKIASLAGTQNLSATEMSDAYRKVTEIAEQPKAEEPTPI